LFHGIKTKFYYGWVIVIVIAITSLALMGARHSFGIFFKSLANEFDLSRAVTSSLFSVYMILCAVVSIVGGWTLDRYGARLAFFLMGLFTGASLLLTSQAGSWWQLFLTYSLLFAIGTGPLYAVGQSVILKWFDRRLGIAMGIAGTGVGIGQMLFAPLAALIIAGYGWRISFIVLGLLVCIFVIPLSRLMRNDPGAIGASPYGDEFRTEATAVNVEEENHQSTGFSLSQAVRSRNYWIYLPAWLFTGFSNWLVLTHIVPYATDMGVPSVEAATIISACGITGMLSGIFIGRITDIKGRKIPGVFLALLRAAALMGLIWAREIWMFYLVAIAFGFCQSGIGIILAALCGDIFGRRHIGVILGTLTAVFSTGAAAGPLVGGLFYDVNSSYTMAFITCAVVSMLVALSIALVRVEAKSETR
jgi:OFA family oxalate/formate antiporter-like MFS transporter